ncbi:PTS fructose transporter subunit IIB [Absicoccus porci]|jgi:PTS system fructose-specific IIB component|uniref:PTS fructose transporter subunit IIB n=1 Tax=Absicoccus porci TaxID=2486576 RepID=UPI003D8DB556
MKIVGAAACPIGVAHTYIAAENIEKVCKEHGYECKMETQGAIGMENELEEDIETADW